MNCVVSMCQGPVVRTLFSANPGLNFNPGRRGSRINADRFPQRAPKRKLLGGPGAHSPGKCLRF